MRLVTILLLLILFAFVGCTMKFGDWHHDAVPHLPYVILGGAVILAIVWLCGMPAALRKRNADG